MDNRKVKFFRPLLSIFIILLIVLFYYDYTLNKQDKTTISSKIKDAVSVNNHSSSNNDFSPEHKPINANVSYPALIEINDTSSNLNVKKYDKKLGKDIADTITNFIEQDTNEVLRSIFEKSYKNVKMGTESELFISISKSYDEKLTKQYINYLKELNYKKIVELIEEKIISGNSDAGLYYILVDNLELSKLPDDPEFERMKEIAKEYKQYKETGKFDANRVIESTDSAIYKKNALINKKINEKIKKYTKEAYKKYPEVPAIIYLASEYILPEKEAIEKLSIAIAKMNKNDILYELMDYQLNLLKKKKQTG